MSTQPEQFAESMRVASQPIIPETQSLTQEMQSRLEQLLMAIPSFPENTRIPVRRSLAFLVDHLSDTEFADLIAEVATLQTVREVDLRIAAKIEAILEQKEFPAKKMLHNSYQRIKQRILVDETARLTPPPIPSDMIPAWLHVQA